MLSQIKIMLCFWTAVFAALFFAGVCTPKKAPPEWMRDWNAVLAPIVSVTSHHRPFPDQIAKDEFVPINIRFRPPAELRNQSYDLHAQLIDLADPRRQSGGFGTQVPLAGTFSVSVQIPFDGRQLEGCPRPVSPDDPDWHFYVFLQPPNALQPFPSGATVQLLIWMNPAGPAGNSPPGATRSIIYATTFRVVPPEKTKRPGELKWPRGARELRYGPYLAYPKVGSRRVHIIDLNKVVPTSATK